MRFFLLVREVSRLVVGTFRGRNGHPEDGERLRPLAGNAGDLVYRYRFRPTPGFDYVSPSATDVTGYTPEEHYADPELGLKLVHPDDRHLLEGVSRDPEKPLVLRWRRKDGAWIWTEQRNKPVYGPTGELVAIEGIARDITESRRTEEALRESEERLRLALEAASLGMWYQDLETGEFVAPPDTAAMHGLPPDTPLDRETALAVVHPEDRSRVGALVERAIATGGSYEAEYRITRPDGTVRWMLSRARVYQEGERRLIGVVQDTTRRKQAERALLVQAQLLDQVQAAVIATDMDGTVVHWNRHAEKLYGWTRQEALGRNILRLTVGPTDAAVAEKIMAHLRGGRPWEGEFETRRKDGSSFPAYVVDALVYEDDGSPAGMVGVSVDLTGRKEAERALRESEARFRAAFGSAALGMALTSLEGKYLQVNPSMCAITGYTEAELLGRDFQSITHPDDLETDMDGLRRLVSGETSYHYSEKRYVHKDGRAIWVLLTAALVRDEAREPLYFVSQVQDVTQARQDREDLVRLERQNRSILASAGEGIYGLDLSERTTFVNPAAENMLGYGPGELVGRHQHEIVRHLRPDGTPYPPEGCPVYAALRDGDVHSSSDEVFWRKDGTSVPVEYVSTPILQDGAVVGAVVTFRDITERRRQEEALRESEARFRLLAEKMGDLVCLHEPDGRYLYLSPSCRRLIGYEPEELLGTDPYDLFHPDDLDRIRNEAHERALDGQAAVTITYRIRKKDGEYTWFETLTEPILDEDGAVVRLQTSSRDVTERRRAEEALAAAARAKTEFLAEVSHELRTPLTVIRGNAEIGLEMDRDCEHEDLLGEIVRESSTMSRMVEDLLFLARSESAVPPFRVEPVATTSLMGGLARRARALAAKHGAGLETASLADGSVRVDPSRIEQAVLALVDNAGKYGPRGGRITLGSTSSDGTLRIEVTDEGPGIPEDDLPRIFERFYRGDGTDAPGNGLGLSVASTIARAHGGRVEAESEPGRGTRVSIILPLLPRPQER